MPKYHDNVLDNGLQYITDNADALWLCSQEPADFTEATATYALASKTGVVVPVPEARTPAGRKVVIPAVTAGSPGDVIATGTATHFALVDTANSRLLVSGAMSASQALTSGNTWTAAAVDAGLIGPEV